jgi:hypothetical protein
VNHKGTLKMNTTVWTWPDDTGHIWEALSPHLSCIHKQLKIKASLEETTCGSVKPVSCKSFKINHARRKMWNCKFPHVSTVMWPSPGHCMMSTTGFDHGAGHPLLFLDDAKPPNCQKNNGFNDLGNYSEWPKVAGAVIQAGIRIFDVVGNVGRTRSSSFFRLTPPVCSA